MHGFRGLEGCIELGPRLNIVAGPNCSGKTAVIEALAYLLALSYSNLRESHGYLALLHAARGSPHHSIASLVQDVGSVRGSVVAEGGEELTEIVLRKTISYEAVGPTIRPVVEVRIESRPRGCEIVYHLSSDGRINLGMHPKCIEESKLSVGLVTPGIYPYDFFDQLVGRAKRNRDRVWQTLSEGVRIDSDVYTADVASDDWGRLTAYVMERGQPVTFYAVGRGLQRALIMLAAIEYSDVVMIDEIESAMHPELLAAMAERVAEAVRESKQIIVTTQSLEAARFLAAAIIGVPRSDWRQPAKLIEALERVCSEEHASESLGISLISLRRSQNRIESITLHDCHALREIIAGEDIRPLYTLTA